MTTIPIPELAEGEIYVGCIGYASGELQHIILLPGDAAAAPHQEQLDWAKSIGGDLPNRIEQSMLWAYHRDQFKKDWYWSNDLYGPASGSAWFHGFYYGQQSYTSCSASLRARAVRRLPV